jgi:hypothetical protein
MVEFQQMNGAVRIILAIAVFTLCFAFAAAVISAEGDNSAPQKNSIDRTKIDDAMAELTSGEKYKYPETALEESALTQWIKGWLQKLNMPMHAGGITLTPGLLVVSLLLSLAVIVAIFVIVIIVIRVVRYQNRGKAGKKGEAGVTNGAMGEWGDLGVSKALEMASTGNFKGAISVLFQAMLRGLDMTGWVSYRRGVASRTYLRQLRKSDQLYPLFRDFLWRFELAYYREAVPSQDDWQYLYTTFGKVASVVNEMPMPSRSRSK